MRLECRRAVPQDFRQWLAGVGAVLLIGLSVAALHVSGIQVCLFRRLTGWPCLTCGSTRAVALLLTAGDVRGAFSRQPAAVVGVLAAAAGCAAYSVCLFALGAHVRVLLEPREWNRVVLALVGLAALNWMFLVWRGT